MIEDRGRMRRERKEAVDMFEEELKEDWRNSDASVSGFGELMNIFINGIHVSISVCLLLRPNIF